MSAIFTGVSGSGKSSVVFDTIATEAQRQLYENFALFIRSFLPRYPQPEADAIENLNMAVIVDQKRLGGGSHSTVGTITDIYTALRLLYSRVARPYVGTLPLGVANYNGTYSQDTAPVLAFTALSMLPALASFVFAERRVVGGVSGAVKG
jgi:excinuclease UvrABC ATPase subunit